MPGLNHKDVQWTPRITLAEVIREFNVALREVARVATENQLASYPQVDAAILDNTTQTIWLPLEGYVIESIALRVSTGTADVTPRIGTTALGVSGGTPITATTTATEYAVDSANEVSALDDVNCIVASMSAGAWLTLALKVRRIN